MGSFGGFASFYKQRQIELFSALDNALSQKAEDTLTEFAAVKNAEVQLQTSLGNRQGQLGINLIGAFAESQNLGIGWQVRAFGGQNDTKGMNAGIFYRRVQNDLLYGINAFADYEDGDNGSFLRYSIGGELQNRYGALVASYYTPITGDKHTGEQVAFSREGYDFNLRLNIPRLDFLNARVDYYHYHGKYNVKEDKGLRYGAEAHLFPGLRVALLYDDDGDELGGDISYTHTIGEVQQSQTANEQWTPDLFAAVSREHSQRIRIVSVNVSVSPPLPPSPNMPNMPTFNAFGGRAIVGSNPATIGAINIPAGYTIGMLPQGFMHTNGTLIWNPIVSGAITFGVSVSNASQTASLAIAATGFVAVGRVANVLFTAGVSPFVAGRNIGFVITTRYKILATLPPSTASRPYVLTVMRNLEAEFTGRNNPSEIISSSEPGFFSIGAFYGFRGAGMIFTITIVEGSEEFQSTLYAKAVMPFDMPGFFPPSSPFMVELALATNIGNPSSIPSHFAFVRRKGFVAKPPLSILL